MKLFPILIVLLICSAFGKTKVIPVSEIEKFNPQHGNSVNQNKVLNQVVENLVSLDDSLAPMPFLAKKWRINNKNKSIKFWLKENVKFHDNSILNSKTIYNNFIYSKDKKNSLTSQIKNFQTCNKANRCKSFKINSKYVFTVYLNDNNFSLFLRKLSSINGGIYKIDKETGYILGTGPYKFEDINSNIVKLTNKFSQNKLLFKVFKDIEPLEAFKNNKIATLDTLQFNINPKILKNYPSKKKIAGTYSLILNLERGLLRDKALRKAIYNILDIKKITYLLNPNFLPATTFIPKGFKGHKKLDREPNLELAKALIGNKYKNVKLKLSLAKNYNSNHKFISYIKKAFNELGIDLVVSFNSFRERVDGFRNGKYDMIIRGDSPTYYDAGKIFISLVSWDYHNMSAYKNKELDTLYKLYEKQTELSSSIKTIHSMEAIIREDLPLIPLCYPVFTEFYQKGTNINNHQISRKFWEYDYHKLL